MLAKPMFHVGPVDDLCVWANLANKNPVNLEARVVLLRVDGNKRRHTLTLIDHTGKVTPMHCRVDRTRQDARKTRTPKAVSPRVDDERLVTRPHRPYGDNLAQLGVSNSFLRAAIFLAARAVLSERHSLYILVSS